jgi:RNA polymerase sigma factor (sigma-70 family)
MTTLEDAELLRRYIADRSEAAFAELVRRHLPTVYGFALRKVGGDAHLAEDVAQVVFTTLARKASSLSGRATLGGWLYRTTHFAARDVVRVERRRRNREQEAETMNKITRNDSEAAIDWEKIRPVLDDTLNELGDDDRDAVWLRFFEGCSFGEVGARLRVTENAARMRVERALDKLHGLLARRGVTSTTAALSVALANQVGVAAPAAGLAASITGAALAGAVGATATVTSGAIGGAAIFMGMTKLQIGITAAMALAGGAAYVAQTRANEGLQREIATLREQQPALTALRAENKALAATAAEIETLRADDRELQRLAQQGEAAKKALEEKARVAAAASETDARAAQTRWVRAEIERMNGEGTSMVGEYKVLQDKTKAAGLTADAKVSLDAEAARKMREIRAKMDELTAFKESYRDFLPPAEQPPVKQPLPTSPQIEQLNREGNVLVAEFQSLSQRANDPALSQEEKATIAAAMQLKGWEINAKQAEVSALMGRPPPGGSPVAPGWSVAPAPASVGVAGSGGFLFVRDPNQPAPPVVSPPVNGRDSSQ